MRVTKPLLIIFGGIVAVGVIAQLTSHDSGPVTKPLQLSSLTPTVAVTWTPTAQPSTSSWTQSEGTATEVTTGLRPTTSVTTASGQQTSIKPETSTKPQMSSKRQTSTNPRLSAKQQPRANPQTSANQQSLLTRTTTEPTPRIATKAPKAPAPAKPAPTKPAQPKKAPQTQRSEAPGKCNIKGNISSKGVKIYHRPGDPNYNGTKIDPKKGERWFCTEQEAQDAGWRAPLN